MREYLKISHYLLVLFFNVIGMSFLLYFILFLNVITFIQIGYDKRLAIQHNQRIPERTLLSFVFFGGTIGSGLAMLLFRHKTSKASYLWSFGEL